MPRVAKVIVDLSLDKEFDYLVPAELEGALQLGSPVIVPFGRREAKGFVVGFAESSVFSDLKPVKAAGGKSGLVDARVLSLAKWMADYYLAPLEPCVRTVLPGAVRKKASGFKQLLHVHAAEKAKDEDEVRRLRMRAPKQASALDTLHLQPGIALQKLALTVGVTTAVIRGLQKKGFVTITNQIVARDPHLHDEVVPSKPHELMPQQTEAMKVVRDAIETGKPPVILLFGVTGSGKTEIYLQSIELVRARGQGAIVLVPEIALTPQTVDRFRSRFGDTVAVLHSELSDGERHDEWHRVHEGKADIVIGPRSAVFAPIKNLGLIVVDEEHESTYKQEETPRYNARDVAVMRGHMEKCPVILGSATPSLESQWNARRGKYALVKMDARVDHQKMPVMHIVDMREEMGREGKLNVLSRHLCDAIHERMAGREQVMLLLNRRGFASSLVCPKCGEVATCPHCSLAMTYHRTTQRMVCHLCGFHDIAPSACPNKECRDPNFRYAGMGTQRVEDVLAKIFPKARVVRMDSDSMSGKDSYRKVLNDFRAHNIDILIGTQMIAKGLHFPNVTLVGVINADIGLHTADFRAGERTFQLLTQVAGRAGRGDVTGQVIVQTFTPHHVAIQCARRLDYDGFFDQEIEYRKELNYPPCSHLIAVHVRGPVEDVVKFAAEAFMRKLQPLLPADILAAGPSPSPLAKINNEFRYQLDLRAARTSDMAAPLRAALKNFPWPDEIKIAVDVDAQSLL